ncbi:calmodulin [Lobosporangium transversale]|uniref:Calmodulin n=1 Tax=Lobosporangium transversale TaxID=64571 RepID=A0A1Y2GK65_9FUNG|nr:calmodulin [Lobosporangium transversale]ORZ13376.1 calmodulin [Lobosporangium transversale]|eukprot:XP_021880457.1 calmodulin [Lobosporangium transversale]
MSNNKYSESETVLIKQQFNAIDKDGDGFITEKEFIESLKNLNRDPEEYDIQRFFSRGDNNKDGKINFNEFLEVYMTLGLNNPNSVSGQPKQKSAQEVSAIFQSFDRDGDGSISAKELKEVLASQGEKPTSSDIDDMIKAADKNNDNKVDREEFAKMV